MKFLSFRTLEQSFKFVFFLVSFWYVYTEPQNPLGIPLLLALGGYWVVHSFNSTRDFNLKKREIKLTYLIETFDNIAMGLYRESDDPQVGKYVENFERAVSRVQLLGTKEEIEIACKLAGAKNKVDWNILLEKLRESLRSELGVKAKDLSFIGHLRMPTYHEGKRVA